MNKKIIQIFCALLLSFFTIGCQNNEDCNCLSAVKSEIIERIPETSFQEGLIIKETPIELRSENNELLAIIILQEDTQFEDKNGVAITEAPILVATIIKESDINELVITFTNIDGEIVIPTKHFNVEIKAPSSAEPQDRVKVEIQEGSSVKNPQVIIPVVSQDGFVVLEITINDHSNATIIINISVLGNGATN
jgi:hypothetical protein